MFYGASKREQRMKNQPEVFGISNQNVVEALGVDKSVRYIEFTLMMDESKY